MKQVFRIKYYIAVLSSLIFVISLQNCERDDICAETTPTTPRLLIEFYDINSTDELKDVPRITVYGEGMFTDESGVTTEPTEASDKIVLDDPELGTYLFNVNKNAIALPLIVGSEGETITTRFVLEKDTNLRLDDSSEDDSNKDIIEITYQTEFIYVSRACGYKSRFTNLLVTRLPDEDNWLSSVEVIGGIEALIENEDTVHVRINH